MIQRIQTVYLLVVAILMIIVMSQPVGSIIDGNNEISTFGNLCITMPDGANDYTPWAMFALLFISALLALVTIFLFKKRMIQIRLTVFNSILLVGYYIVTGIFVMNSLTEEMTFNASWTLCLPFVALVLNWLAIRAIGKDEVLVKAYERLR